MTGPLQYFYSPHAYMVVLFQGQLVQHVSDAFLVNRYQSRLHYHFDQGPNLFYWIEFEVKWTYGLDAGVYSCKTDQRGVTPSRKTTPILSFLYMSSCDFVYNPYLYSFDFIISLYYQSLSYQWFLALITWSSLHTWPLNSF